MLRVGGEPNVGRPGEDVEYRGLIYPDGDELSKHLVQYLTSQPFYQSDKLAQALAQVKNRRLAVDCGAWVGGWSRELAKHFERVIAIEADPDNARCARKNLAAYRNAEVLNVAVGEESGTIGVRTQLNGPKVGTYVAKNGAMIVGMERLDTILASVPWPVDYMKVHVNGMELKALRGAVQTIKKHRPLLTVVLKGAIKDYGDSAEDARAFLTDVLGYRRSGGEKPYEIWKPA